MSIRDELKDIVEDSFKKLAYADALMLIEREPVVALLNLVDAAPQLVEHR